MYRVGLPFCKLLARCGVPVHLRIMVQRDAESDMLVATSPDFDGLVVDSATMGDLMIETREVIS